MSDALPSQFLNTPALGEESVKPIADAAPDLGQIVLHFLPEVHQDSQFCEFLCRQFRLGVFPISNQIRDDFRILIVTLRR
jgi:hypothetical protein